MDQWLQNITANDSDDLRAFLEEWPPWVDTVREYEDVLSQIENADGAERRALIKERDSIRSRLLSHHNTAPGHMYLRGKSVRGEVTRMERKARYSADEIRGAASYERAYEGWMAELRRAQQGIASTINDTAAAVETLMRDAEASQDWERIAEMQALLQRMLNENDGLPGLKSERQRRATKVTPSPGAHSAYR